MIKTIASVCAVAIMAVGLAGCGGYSDVILTPEQQSTTKLGALEYAQRADLTFGSCSGQDSAKNGERPDGYVTCTMFDKQKKAVSLQCSYKAPGCK